MKIVVFGFELLLRAYCALGAQKVRAQKRTVLA